MLPALILRLLTFTLYLKPLVSDVILFAFIFLLLFLAILSLILLVV
ncbi:hypothetical protein SJAV_08400 [Sulfurisphaera javensis]|uniref:Uncharacterized protein n=1 Tax=Sulfurisphaera javensis TaxID=2049879 RepID=A0AAT9GQ17_9CREN